MSLLAVFVGRSSVFTRCEHFLTPRAQELELEDHQSRLEQKLRQKMLKEGEYSDMFGAPVKDLSPQQGTCTEHAINPKAGVLFPSCASSLEAKGEAL